MGNRVPLTSSDSQAADTQSRRTAGQTLSSLVVALLAIFIFGATFRTGIQLGMDQKVVAWGRVLNAVAAVITDWRYRTGGYLISDTVFSQLENGGFTGDPALVNKLGLTLPDNLQASHLDDLLQRTKRNLASIPEPARLRGLGEDDIGFIDFVRIAFWIFGLQIRSFYYLFFLIFGTSLLIALVERAQDRLGQLIVLVTASIIFASCYYSDVLLVPQLPGLGNIVEPSFMSVLGLVPTVHIMLMMAGRVRPNWQKVALVVPQAGIIFFALHMRSTAVWLVGALLLAMLALSTPFIREALKREDRYSTIATRFFNAQWPAIISLLIVAAGFQIVSLSLNSVYKGGFLHHHAFWHAVYYSLQENPQYAEKYNGGHVWTNPDDMPVAAAENYLKEHPEEDRPQIYFPGSRVLRYDALERLERLAFFEFLRRDPRFVIETFADKGTGFFVDLWTQTRLEWSNAPPWQRAALVCVLLAIALLASGRGNAFCRLRLFTAVFSLGAVASLAIPVLTVAYVQVEAEEIMAIQLMILMWLSVGLAFIRLFSRRYLPVPKPSKLVKPALARTRTALMRGVEEAGVGQANADSFDVRR